MWLHALNRERSRVSERTSGLSPARVRLPLKTAELSHAKWPFALAGLGRGGAASPNRFVGDGLAPAGLTVPGAPLTCPLKAMEMGKGP